MEKKLCNVCHGSGRDPVTPDKLSCCICGGSGHTYEYRPSQPQPGHSSVRRPSQKYAPPPPVFQGKVSSYSGSKFLFRRSGHGTSEHVNGLVYEGNWSAGKWHGEGVLRRPGRWMLKGKFKNGLLQGPGTLTLDDGTLFEGRFKKSVPLGKGSVRFPGGMLFQGSWANCETATGKLRDADGQAYKARISDGELKYKAGFFSGYKSLGDFNLRDILAGRHVLA